MSSLTDFALGPYVIVVGVSGKSLLAAGGWCRVSFEVSYVTGLAKTGAENFPSPSAPVDGFLKNKQKL